MAPHGTIAKFHGLKFPVGWSGVRWGRTTFGEFAVFTLETSIRVPPAVHENLYAFSNIEYFVELRAIE